MSNSAGTSGSSSNETPAAPNASNGSPPQNSSSPPGGGGGGGNQTQSPPSPPPSNNSSSSNSPPSPPPSSNSPPPSPSNNSSTPSPPSNSSPPPKASSPPPKASPQPPPPTTTTPPSSSTSPPTPPPPASSKESPPLSPPPSSPPPPSNDNAPAPPSNDIISPPASQGSQSPPPPPQNSISPPTPLSPPTEPSQTPAPDSSPPILITPPGPKSPSPSTHRGTPSSAHPSNTKSEGGNADSPNTSPPSFNTEKTVAGVAVASVFLIALIAIFFVVSKRRKRKRVDAYTTHFMPPNTFSVKSDGYYYAQPQSMGHSGPADPYQPPTHSHLGNSYGSQRGQMSDSGVIGGNKNFFSYEEMMEITNGFSRQAILGEGGFGCVYKGQLPDGKLVAVKQLKAGSGQGEREFRAEVDIISRVHHRHLVSLVGYCISESHRLLIYEFVSNKTLEYHLFEGSPALDWPKRVKIAVGAAKGLAYLHEDCHPKIIHRDIKSANILLDDDFEAQVADFGLAKLNDSTQTHVSTRVMGTFGYMAPEYASSGKLTDRSDVYSFGVVLLELITGRKPVDPTQPLGDESLVEWARPLLVHALETGDITELVDPRLQKHYMESEVFRMIEAAAACVRHSAPKRPRMVQVVRALDSEGEMSDLSNGVRYGQSTVYDSGQYNQEIKNFRRMALGSNDSAEYDMQSGDYTSREHGFPNSWKSSSEFTSGELETRAMNGNSRAKANYVAPRF